MELALRVMHELVKFAGLLYIGQGLVRVLSFGRHEGNPIYRFLRFLTSPITHAVRRFTPKAVLDRHVPFVAFLLLFWAWLLLIFVRRSMLLPGA